MSDSTENRRKQILWAVVREFVDSAEPVGSATIVEKYDFGVSPATVRNDMVWLEEQGLLKQPHPSAGRIPTELGYRYFVNEFVAAEKPRDPQEEHRQQLAQLRRLVRDDLQRSARLFAQQLAQLTEGTAFTRLENGRLHLAGLSNLVKHPEFRDTELLFAVTQALDRLEQTLAQLEGRMRHDVEVLIGTDNPFGCGTSAVVVRYADPQIGQGIVGLLGPERMDYESNYNLMRYLRDVFSE